MLSALIKELQAVLDAKGDIPMDIVIPGTCTRARRSVRTTAVFVRDDGVLQITVE